MGSGGLPGRCVCQRGCVGLLGRKGVPRRHASHPSPAHTWWAESPNALPHRKPQARLTGSRTTHGGAQDLPAFPCRPGPLHLPQTFYHSLMGCPLPVLFLSLFEYFIKGHVPFPSQRRPLSLHIKLHHSPVKQLSGSLVTRSRARTPIKASDHEPRTTLSQGRSVYV